MTYREPQTPLFPPYVNLVNAKDHRKIGESEHNTDCDVTIGITIVTPPTFAYNRPCSRPAEPAQPSHLKFCRFCEETREHNSKNGRSWNMFQVVQGWVGVCIQNTNSLYTIQNIVSMHSTPPFKSLLRYFLFYFTFMHLADVFIQRDLHCIQAIHFCQCVCRLHTTINQHSANDQHLVILGNLEILCSTCPREVARLVTLVWKY